MTKINSKMRLFLTSLGMLLISTTVFSQYCEPAYSTGTGAGDYIDGVVVGGISNTGSGVAITGVGYSDYTALTTDLTIGTSYTMTCTNNPSWSQTYTAWIDGNHDNIFDVSEVIGNLSLAAGASGSFSFTLPAGVMEGATRMRVRCIYPSGLAMPLDPCASATYGEAEDYTVVIDGALAIDGGVSNVTGPISGPTLGTESVAITVQNYGSDAISGFTVNYSIDGGATVSETYAGTIAAYAAGSYTFTSTYDFSTDGCYSVYAWTSIDGDGNEANNDFTEAVCNLLPITGTGAVYVYSNSTGGEPWFSISNTTAMNTVFGVEGVDWTRSYFETVDVAGTFSPDNCFVFLEGSDSHAAELETFLNANLETIEGWVASGGKLLLNAAPNEGDGMNFGFGATSLVYAYYTNSATAVDAGHPIFNEPFTPAGTDYTGSSFGHARITGTGLSSVMVDLFAPDNVVLTEKSWGAGHVMFGGMTTNNYHSPLENAANLRANILAYLGCVDIAFCDVPEGLFVDGITTNDAVLHWTAIDGADQYRVTLQNTVTGLTKTKGYYTNEVVITDKLTPLTTYAFRVKQVCYDDLGEISAPSPWYYFTTLGRLDGSDDAAVSLYPNPSNGTFNINVAGYSNNTFNLVVSNATGQAVYNKTITVDSENYNEVISLENAAPGMYQVSLMNADYQLNYSIVVLK